MSVRLTGLLLKVSKFSQSLSGRRLNTLSTQGTGLQNAQMDKEGTHTKSSEGDLMSPDVGAKVGEPGTLGLRTARGLRVSARVFGVIHAQSQPRLLTTMGGGQRGWGGRATLFYSRVPAQGHTVGGPG